MFDKPAEPILPDPLETQLGQEWSAAQLAQQHLGEVITKIVEAWRRDRVEKVALRADLDQAQKRIAELETAYAELAKEQVPGIAKGEAPGINDDPE